MYQEFNESIERRKFPSKMKLADINQVFKKECQTKEDNCRPISTSSNLSKIFERCMYKQLSLYLDNILSKCQCIFRKRFNQHCLIKFLEKWKQSLENGLVFGALLTDLLKTFDCLSHELLAAKLIAYEVEISSVTLKCAYLTNRRFRTKVGNKYSS